MDLERAVLVGVDTDEDDYEQIHSFEHEMEELENLAKACFMETVAVVTQKLAHVNKGLFIGSGKAAEIKEIAERLDADVVLFNNALTPSQLNNLQKVIDKPVMDRTALILDIFESRARTREAKLQVETAKLQYLLPRLVGMHKALTRQGGASGSMSAKGSGEKKLELDRRRIEHRLTELRKELNEVTKERNVQRAERLRSRNPLVALVGYTNAGKSTIMNALVERFIGEEEKKVLEKDMLFATLDTTVRRISTGDNRDFLLSDTVGFIHKLPHGLVKAFRSTLEEVQNADLLVQVVDYSDPFHEEQIKITQQTLSELSAGDIPMLTVYNKMDLCKEDLPYPKTVRDVIYLSAKEEASISMLVQAILERVYSDLVEATLLVPYEKGGILSFFMENAYIISMEHEAEGTRLKVKCHKADREKYREYLR